MSGLLLTRVRSVARVSPRTRLLLLDTGRRAFPFTPGQAVLAGLATQHDRRPYSLASAPADVRRTGCLELLVGLNDDGSFGAHLDPVAEGSIVAVDGPLGAFGLPRGLSGRSLTFIAGGTGIAPLRSMIRDTLGRPVPVAIDVVYSARTRDDLVFHDELRAWHASGRLRYWPTVTRPEGQAWNGRFGRIDAVWLHAILRPRPICVVCGPPVFCDDMTAALRSLRVPARSVRRERY